LDNVKKSAAITNVCPVCHDEEFVTYPQKEADREIKSLHIYCTNKEKGCEWKGELNCINNHLGNSDGCQFEGVKCSNECGKMMERQYLTNHVESECPRRKVNCQYCHDRGEHHFIEGQHKEECPKLPLPCPNKCEVESVPREDMEAHRKECPLEMIQCEYYSVGCKRIKLARKDNEKHKKENMEDHLKMTTLVLNDTKVELANTKDELTQQNQRINTLEVLMYLTTDKAVTRPTSSTTVVESSLRWSDKLTAMVMMSKSGDQECPVIFKMVDFNKQKENSVIWYSDSFYTHNKGYKMCLNIDASGHGDGKGTHLSVFLYLMKDPHDDELKWPLRGKFEITLLNQISDSHYSMTLSYDDHKTDDYNERVTEGERNKVGWGHHQFISNEDLYKTTLHQFLKDDCLFIQVTKL